jgi:WD40 repeat protein
VALSPDGHTLAAGSADTKLRLWNMTQLAHPTLWGQPLTGFGDAIWSVAFSPDGHTLAVGTRASTVWLWSVTNRARPTPLLQHFYRRRGPYLGCGRRADEWEGPAGGQGVTPGCAATGELTPASGRTAHRSPTDAYDTAATDHAVGATPRSAAPTGSDRPARELTAPTARRSTACPRYGWRCARARRSATRRRDVSPSEPPTSSPNQPREPPSPDSHRYQHPRGKTCRGHPPNRPDCRNSPIRLKGRVSTDLALASTSRSWLCPILRCCPVVGFVASDYLLESSYSRSRPPTRKHAGLNGRARTRAAVPRTGQRDAREWPPGQGAPLPGQPPLPAAYAGHLRPTYASASSGGTERVELLNRAKSTRSALLVVAHTGSLCRATSTRHSCFPP